MANDGVIGNCIDDTSAMLFLMSSVYVEKV